MWKTPATDIAGERLRTSRGRRGLTIGHWLMIIIFVALCADIGIRILAFRQAQQQLAQNAASERTFQQVLQTMRRRDEAMDTASAKSKKSMETIERLMKQMEEIREPSDSE